MSEYITDIEVSLTPEQEQQLKTQGFHQIKSEHNLNTEKNRVLIWYKKQYGSASVTRIQVSFNNDMCEGLNKGGYTKVSQSLIPGNSGVYLWYFRGITRYDIPIVKLDITATAQNEAEKIKLNWERAGCNLSKASGQWVYLWVKREQQTYICDIKATDSFETDPDLFQAGYIRDDESTNTSKVPAFIWHRQTNDAKRGLTDVQISVSDEEYKEFQDKKYSPLSVNLNEGRAGSSTILWYKTETGKSPIKSILVLINSKATSDCDHLKAKVIKKDLNADNNGQIEYLCFS